VGAVDVTPSPLRSRRRSADNPCMTALTVPDTRLQEAYERYERVVRATGPVKPGTPAPADLVQARLDLVLLLAAAGEELPGPVVAQCAVDADLLSRRVAAL
jgi:hypothetical protein